MPKPAVAETAGFLERFDREARMLQRLHHPHIVPIIDFGSFRHLPFLAMPFLPGGSLRDRRLRDDAGDPLPNHIGMLHFWLPGIASALDHLHMQGVVHRDVKPSNIFFDIFWHAFLGDFGVAKVFDETGGVEKEETLTGTNMAMGTGPYMAPEMFSPKPTLTQAIDQYALAVVAYEMVAGRRPFTGETTHPIVEVTTQPPPPLDRLRTGLPTSLVQAVHRGLAKRPQDRFPSCVEFSQAVLQHVGPLEAEPGIARLACPNPECRHIIRISTGDAGREGKCPKCRKRLVIADDLSGIWTREQQGKVSAHLVGQTIASTDTGSISDVTAEEGPFEFKPLSKSVPLPKSKRNHGYWVFLATATAVLLSLAGGAVLVRQLWPRPLWVIDQESSVTVDDGRLVVLSPNGFRRSSQSSKYIVEYAYRAPGRLPRIRVLAGGTAPTRAKAVDIGGKRGRLWTQAATENAGAREPLSVTNCWLEIGGRPYTVEVAVQPSQGPDGEQLCRLVTSALKSGEPNPKPDPPSLPDRMGLRVEYFVGRDLRQKIDYPADIEVSSLQFDWFDGPPVAGLPSDEFSIRWSGVFIPGFSGQHRFVGYRDNGLRIWVNGKLLLDEWNDGWGDFSSSPIGLTKGKRYPIKIEYYEHNGGAHLTVKVKGEAGEAEVLEPRQLQPAL